MKKDSGTRETLFNDKGVSYALWSPILTQKHNPIQKRLAMPIQARINLPAALPTLIPTSAWRQRPVESTNTVHVLPVLRLLDFVHSVVLVVSRDFSVLGRAEVFESHHASHLGF